MTLLMVPGENYFNLEILRVAVFWNDCLQGLLEQSALCSKARVHSGILHWSLLPWRSMWTLGWDPLVDSTFFYYHITCLDEILALHVARMVWQGAQSDLNSDLVQDWDCSSYTSDRLSRQESLMVWSWQLWEWGEALVPAATGCCLLPFLSTLEELIVGGCLVSPGHNKRPMSSFMRRARRAA